MKRLLLWLRQKYYRLRIGNALHRVHKRLMLRNHFDCTQPVSGEKEWQRSFSIAGYQPSLIHYRLFSHYIGTDRRIVPEDVVRLFIEPTLNPGEFVSYYSDKNMFDKIFPAGFFPRTLIRKIRGAYYSKDYQPLSLTETGLSEALLGFGGNQIIVKPTVDTSSGRGVRLFHRDGGLWREHGSGQPLTVEFLESHYGNDLIIQEGIRQSPYLSQFNPTSVNTIRLTVYRSVQDNRCHVTSGILRIGGRGSVVDNAHQGGCFFGLHLDGTLGKFGADQHGGVYKIFNGIDFERGDWRLPDFEKVIHFAARVGNCVLHHRLLALDIVMTEDNQPKLLEINVSGYSSWLFQFTIGPALGDYVDEIMDFCRRNPRGL